MSKSLRLHTALWATAILPCLGLQAKAATTWNLASDFSLAENSASSTWSYGLAAAENNPIHTANLFSTNTRSANDLWGTGFATPPMMWSQTTGYWGIGRNDSGVAQTSNPISWAPGEILIHPKNTTSDRLVISWLAPSSMTVGIDYSWGEAMPMPPGLANGVGLRIWHGNTILTDTSGNGWLEPSSGGGSGTLSNLSVTAGDRLFFEYDTLDNPNYDVTRTGILITAVPEPGTTLLGALGLLALLRRRRRRVSREMGFGEPGVGEENDGERWCCSPIGSRFLSATPRSRS